MALNPITAGSLDGRILLALRAGEMETTACYERFPSFGAIIGGLARAGLVERGDDSYRITAAGRAACPFRNPKAAPPGAAKPIKELQPMSATAGVTPTKVITRIIAAGPAGISPKALAEEFGISKNGIYYHIKVLGAAVLKTFGIVVAACYANPETPAEVLAEADKIAQEYAEMIDFEIEPAAEAPAETTAERVARRARDMPEYLYIDDPEMVEMAVFSSGGMDIYFDDNTISLSAPVLAKLRAFLGVS